MGKPTGYMEVERKDDRAADPLARVQHYREFHAPLKEADRRAQAARCKDCGVPFCQAAVTIEGHNVGCPLHNLVPEWNDFLYRGNDTQALHRLLKTNNFPEFTSRVCPAFCESACTGLLHGTAVTNRENERFIIERAFAAGEIRPRIPEVHTGKSVAVVGSGPAGLAAAQQLSRRGHRVVIFEREDRPGGLLMYGIPNMKLEKNIVKRRTDLMAAEGMEFRLNTEVGRDVTAEELLAEFDAVVLAVGAPVARDVKVTVSCVSTEGPASCGDADGTGTPNAKPMGVQFAVPYLTASTRSLLDGTAIPEELSAAGKSVLVIGGGDTANDCIATAVRQGCQSVTQFTRQPEAPLVRRPDRPWPLPDGVRKTDYGQEEAAAVFGQDPRMYQSMVKEFLVDEAGKLVGVKGVKVASKKTSSGKRRMAEIPNSEFRLDCDLVLIANGFTGAEPALAQAFGLKLTPAGNLLTQTPEGHSTSDPRIFAAGDCRRGSSLVVWAIREGRETAREVDQYLMGYSNLTV